jgi:autotransporter family porin
MSPWTSTAYNLDLAATEMRRCYNGQVQYMRGNGYGAGDMWGCFGWWFSGGWRDSGAQQYIAHVQGEYYGRIWETAEFLANT